MFFSRAARTFISVFTVTITACGGGSGGSASTGNAQQSAGKLLSPQWGLQMNVDPGVYDEGFWHWDGGRFVAEHDPASINDLLGRMADNYLDHWVTTRVAWQATPEMAQKLDHVVINDCVFTCDAAENGLCSGSVRGKQDVKVALYRLRSSNTKPAGWDTGELLLPRRSTDLQALAARGGDYWTEVSTADYYWCDLPRDNFAMTALMHEWDHVLPNMDPHNPADLALVLPLPLGMDIHNDHGA